MPETPGKRQRGEAKAKRRLAKEERRAARKKEGKEPARGVNDGSAEAQEGSS